MIAIAAVKRLMFATLLLFAAVALAAIYWAFAGGNSILLRDDNPRLIEAIARIRRGGIYDQQEQLLVESVAINSGMRRSYLRPSTFSLVGYYSLRYGSAGVEAAFKRALMGSDSSETMENYFQREILNVPHKGLDVRLTLISDIQDALTLAMRGYRGAAVVMDSKSGAILAMASLPAYDPNTLDEDWESLVADEGRPFFNRAIQGLYQPGMAMTTFWLAHAIQSGFDLSTRFTGPDTPVELEPGLSFQCLFQPASETITLIEAFISGCPAPFINYQATLTGDAYGRIVETFALEEATSLAGFPVPGAGANEATDIDAAAASIAWHSRDVLGQGDLTLTPLQMATIMTAMASSGEAPAPYILSGIRQMGADLWEEEKPGPYARIMLATETTATLRGVFQESWQKLAVASASRDPRVGANIAISRSGKDTQIWLNGFAKPDESPALAFVVVLEDTDEIEALVSVDKNWRRRSCLCKSSALSDKQSRLKPQSPRMPFVPSKLGNFRSPQF